MRQQHVDSQAGHLLTVVARHSLVNFVNGQPIYQPDLPQLPPVLQEKGASFVTLTRQGLLRGCIGSTEPRWPLAEDVAHNAVAAASRDPRFLPVTASELDRVRLEVTVLTPPQRLDYVDYEDLCRRLRPGVDGVMLTCEGRRGLLLPQVWRRIPQTTDFLQAIARKAGIPPAELRRSPPVITAHTFQVQHFAEAGYQEPGG